MWRRVLETFQIIDERPFDEIERINAKKIRNYISRIKLLV